jgi:hypothetical protein
LAQEYRLIEVSAWPITPLHLYCILFRIGSAERTDEIVAQLSRDPRVHSAQPLRQYETRGTSLSGD